MAADDDPDARDDPDAPGDGRAVVGGQRVAAVAEVPADGTLLFTVREGFEEDEVVLTRPDGGVAAWRNFCPHWTDVHLDKGGGATVRGDELVCGKHGAMFEKDTGRCTHGPCEGAYLDEVDVTVVDGDVYLTDDRYEFEHLGPAGDRDLSSNRSLGFD